MDERREVRGRDVYRHWERMPTRWADNDAYGHVNNVAYYGWFDTVVNRWLVDRGLLDLGGGQVIGLVVETGCRYLMPLAFPQTVELGLSVRKIGNSSVRYGLGVFSETSLEAAAEGFFVHVYVDRQTRRPLSLSEEWRQQLSALLS